MSDIQKLEKLAERAQAIAKEIHHNKRMLEILDQAKVGVNIQTEYFSGNFDFSPELTEWIRERIREQLTERLGRARMKAQELMRR